MSGAGNALLWTLQAEGKAEQRRVPSGSPATWAVRLFWPFREVSKRQVWLTCKLSLSGTGAGPTNFTVTWVPGFPTWCGDERAQYSSWKPDTNLRPIDLPSFQISRI